MKKILLISMMLLGYITMQGQTQQRQTQQRPIVCIDGLELDTFYTDAQIRAVLGEPTEFSTWDDEFGGGREYAFRDNTGRLRIRYQAADGIVYFFTNSSLYRLFGKDLHIGDNISKITSEFGSLKRNTNRNEYLNYDYELYPRGMITEYFWRIYVNPDNSIRSVSITVPN